MEEMYKEVKKELEENDRKFKKLGKILQKMEDSVTSEEWNKLEKEYLLLKNTI